jgi:ferredoxin--NADP+ reductase
MIGLRGDNGKPLLRAYSIVSASYEEHLEFLSIKVPDGPLTSKLQHIQPGDKIVVGRKPTGTLLIDYLLPGKHLYLLGSGTGLAPFLSIVRDPETYARFDKVIIVHGVRLVDELAYQDYMKHELPQHEFLGEMVSRQMLYYPTVTREPAVNFGDREQRRSSFSGTTRSGLMCRTRSLAVWHASSTGRSAAMRSPSRRPAADPKQHYRTGDSLP